MQSIQSDLLEGYWFGPMPVNTFFDEFMPNPGAPPLELLPDCRFSTLPQPTRLRDSQKSMEQQLLRLMREAAADFGAKLGTNMEFLIEIRHGPKTACDPFNLEPVGEKPVNEGTAVTFLATAEERIHPTHIFDCKCTQFCRGRLSHRFRRWFNIQPRTHGFVIFIGNPWARFIRIDRTGAVYSEKFNFREASNVLLSFLWRFSHMSVEETGLDTTIRPASVQEIGLASASLKYFRDYYHGCDKPSMVIKIPHHQSAQIREVVSCWPSDPSTTELIGRGTRAWPVYDLELRKVVYFKESWRSLERGLQKESFILSTLNKAHIKHIPQMICGDDLRGKWFITKSQLYPNAKWNLTGKDYQPDPRVAHRFTVDLIGIHLDQFTSTRNLFAAVYDAFIAHRDAYRLCGILHCDISPKNILMDKNGRGFLNDWDMAKTINTLKHTKYSLGTWAFMSLGLVRDVNKNNDVHDDIESFFYLMVYFLLRYARHNKSEKETVENMISTIFDDPEGKLEIHEILTDNWDITQNEPMNQWIREAGKAVKGWTDQWRQENWKTLGHRGLKNHNHFIYLFKKFLRSERYASAWPDPRDDSARDCLEVE